MTVAKASSFLLVGFMGMAPIGAARADWVVTEIPTPPEWTGSTEAFDINSSGIVCGNGNYVSGASCVPFRFDGATLTELPYLAPGAAEPFAYGASINAGGTVAGWSHNADSIDRAVTWIGETVVEIPAPPDVSPTDDMRGYGINDAGVVVGYYVSTNGLPTAFYCDGATHSLKSALKAAGLTGGLSYAKGVNNNGLICGEAQDAGSKYNWYTYDVGTGTVNVLGKILAAESYFTAGINAAGHVVGRGRVVLGGPNVALVHDGSFRTIDSTVQVHQWAADITDAGRVVGHNETGANTWSWYSNGPGPGSMVRVDLPGWTRVNIQAINSSDVMIGYGRTAASGTLERGFIVAPPAGDADHDGDVDLQDLAGFVECLSGPKEGNGFAVPSQPCRHAFDFAPADGDVDLADFAGFQAAMTGPP